MGAYIFIMVLILISSVLLSLVVLVQNSKGGGLASNFAGSNQYMGVRKTADFLEKTTWSLAIFLVVLTLASILVIPRGTVNTTVSDTELREQIENSQPIPSSLVPPPQEN
jgi:preprotein translocase subunit SecG